MRIEPYRPRLRFTPLAIAALTGFALSLAVHGLTYFNIAAQEHLSPVWALHVGIFIVFFPFVWRVRQWQRAGQLNWTFLRYFPRAIVALGVLVFVFAQISALLSFLGNLTDAAPVIDEAAHEGRVALLRAFSSGWLVFYGVPALFYLYVPAAPSVEPEPARRGQRHD